MAQTLNVLGKFLKKPAAVKRYQIDFSEWLDTGEIVSGCTFTVAVSAGTEDPVTLEITSSDIISAGTIVAFFVAGGIDGVTYQVTAHATTSGSQEDDFEVFFTVRA